MKLTAGQTSKGTTAVVCETDHKQSISVNASAIFSVSNNFSFGTKVSKSQSATSYVLERRDVMIRSQMSVSKDKKQRLFQCREHGVFSSFDDLQLTFFFFPSSN